MFDAFWNVIEERKVIKKNIESVAYNQQKSLLEAYKSKRLRNARDAIKGNMARSARSASVNGESMYKITKELITANEAAQMKRTLFSLV